MTVSPMDTLKSRLGEVLDLRAAIALLEYDQEVHMPPKGAPGRGRQLATLSGLAHRHFVSEEVGGLLDACADLPGLDGDDAVLLDEVRYDFEQARKLPAEFVEECARAQSKAFSAWVGARKESDFFAFRPHLQELVELAKRKADFLGYEDSPYDALLDEYERGMTTAKVSVLFAELAEKQRALLDRILAQDDRTEYGWLDQTWDEEAQWNLSLRLLADMGYDFEAGRQDKSVHPFTIGFGLHDVRITTRISADEPFSSLTGSIHEGGHALYEQGFREEDERSWLGQAPSLGIHESQSRLWENVVGRSRAYWAHYAPILRQHFPGQLDNVADEQIYRAMNRVRPSLIRVEADECTYNLHIILRFEIETALIEGRISADEVPEVWNAKMKDYLGLEVPDDAQGCLQDVHWSHGGFGYFPTYALGNLYAAQLFEQVRKDLPRVWEDIREGDFAPLLGWLRAHVHRAGRRKTAEVIVEDATGQSPGAAAYLRYLEDKFCSVES